jgi:predicted cupin superfamily sugar epimerase
MQVCLSGVKLNRKYKLKLQVIMKKAEYYITKLGLTKHPEGGWFKEIYRSDETILREHLPERFKGERAYSTSIYFLLTSGSFSAFHRISSDELWHFYAGSSVTIYMIDDSGKYSELKVGSNLESGEVFQCVIPKGVWFAASVNAADSYSLVGCTVAPGFHFDDFELGNREKMILAYPQHKELIKQLTNG